MSKSMKGRKGFQSSKPKSMVGHHFRGGWNGHKSAAKTRKRGQCLATIAEGEEFVRQQRRRHIGSQAGKLVSSGVKEEPTTSEQTTTGVKEEPTTSEQTTTGVGEEPTTPETSATQKVSTPHTKKPFDPRNYRFAPGDQVVFAKHNIDYTGKVNGYSHGYNITATNGSSYSFVNKSHVRPDPEFWSGLDADAAKRKRKVVAPSPLDIRPTVTYNKTGRMGTPGDYIYVQDVSEEKWCKYLEPQAIADVVNIIGLYGYRKQKPGKREIIHFEVDPASNLSADDILMQCYSNCARETASLIGIRAASDDVHVRPKPAYLYKIHHATDSTTSTDTNAASTYVCHRRHPEIEKLIRTNKTFKKLLRIMDNIVLKYHPKCHRFILETIAPQYRLYHDMIWTQCGMTGVRKMCCVLFVCYHF